MHGAVAVTFDVLVWITIRANPTACAAARVQVHVVLGSELTAFREMSIPARLAEALAFAVVTIHVIVSVNEARASIASGDAHDCLP